MAGESRDDREEREEGDPLSVSRSSLSSFTACAAHRMPRTRKSPAARVAPPTALARSLSFFLSLSLSQLATLSRQSSADWHSRLGFA